MNIYKNRRKITIIVLLSIILTLLLSLNFRIWSGSYTEGDLESIVVQQMDTLKKGNIEDSHNNELIKQSQRLLDYVSITGIEINACFLCGFLFLINILFLYLRPSITLCSLSVRMDH